MNKYPDDMDWLRIPLENAVKSTFPMRSIEPSEWCYAGNFTIIDRKYAFYGDLNESKITCRCVNDPSFPNHWFKLYFDYNEDGREAYIGEYI